MAVYQSEERQERTCVLEKNVFAKRLARTFCENGLARLRGLGLIWDGRVLAMTSGKSDAFVNEQVTIQSILDKRCGSRTFMGIFGVLGDLCFLDWNRTWAMKDASIDYARTHELRKMWIDKRPLFLSKPFTDWNTYNLYLGFWSDSPLHSVRTSLCCPYSKPHKEFLHCIHVTKYKNSILPYPMHTNCSCPLTNYHPKKYPAKDWEPKIRECISILHRAFIIPTFLLVLWDDVYITLTCHGHLAFLNISSPIPNLRLGRLCPWPKPNIPVWHWALSSWNTSLDFTTGQKDRVEDWLADLVSLSDTLVWSHVHTQTHTASHCN